DHGAAGVRRSEAGEPGASLAHDGRNGRIGLSVVDGGGLAVEAEVRGERRLEARPAGLALQRLEQRGFLAANVGARADERVEVEIDARTQDILAQQPRRVRLLQSR